MSETVERNNRFYEQSNGEMLTENEQLKEWLKIANKSNEELQKERDMYKDSFETMSTNYFRLENIIKEVREDLYQVVKWCTENKHNEDTIERYLVVDYGTVVGKINEIRTKLDKEVN